MAPPSTIQGTFQRCGIEQLHAQVSRPNTISNQILSHSCNADTAQAELDYSLAEQQSLKRGMTVPESQQPLLRTITVLEVQEQSTMKRIDQ